MKYFKHYSNAHGSELLENIIQEFGFEGYGRYWRFLEYLSGLFDGEEVCFRVHNRSLRDIMRFRSQLKLDSYMVAIGLLPSIKAVKNGKHYEIEAPILLKLKSRDYKKARPKREESALEEKRLDKSRLEESITTDTHPFKTPNVSITPTEITELYNSELAGQGKLKKISGFDLAPQSANNFLAMIGFKKYQTLIGWIEYFKEVSRSDFLTGRKGKGGFATLSWLLDPNNAEKVNQGQYQNDTEVKKTKRSLSHLDRSAS